MLIKTLPVGPLQVNCSIVVCEETRQAVVIDPGDDAGEILREVKQADSEIKLIINTHGHFDHIGGNAGLIAASGAELMMHADDVPVLQQAAVHAGIYGLSVTPSPDPDRLLADGESVTIGSLTFSVLHVPGHSPGGICLLIENDIFVGDCLFAGSIGRTDLPGGNHDLLISGIRQKLLPLADDTVVHPGHGPDTTIGREREHNPFLR